MAAIAADVGIKISGDSSSLQTDLKKASSKVKTFGAATRNTAKDVMKYASGAVATAVVATAALYARQSDVIDSLAKTADALGVTTQSLQAMNHMAELNGVSSEQMANGLRKMETKLGEAALKGGMAADALTRIGLKVEDIISLSPEQQLQSLADALGGVENQSIRASIATDLFGREGIRMLKVLNQVSEDGIAPTVKELEDMGVAISRVDAAKVEAANDAFAKAKKVIEGVANAITVELAPYVTALSDDFLSAAKAAGGFGGFTTKAINGVIRALGFLGNAVTGVKAIFYGLGTFAASIFETIIYDVQVLVEYLNKIPGVNLGGTMEALAGVRESVGEFAEEMKTTFDEVILAPIPSEKAELYIESVKNTAQAAAQAVAKVQKDVQDDNLKTVKKYNKLEAAEELRNAKISIDGVNKKSRKLFEIQKAAAIAQATVSGIRGAIDTWNNYPYPYNIPLTALHVAGTLSQLQSLRSQSFGGGGGAASAPAGGGSGAAIDQATGGATGGGGGGDSAGTIFVDNVDADSLFTGSVVRSLAEKLGEHQKNGGEVIFT